MASSNQTIRVNDITNSPLPDLISSPQTCVKNLYVSTAASAPSVVNTSPSTQVAITETVLTLAQTKSGFHTLTGTPGAFNIHLPSAASLVGSFASPMVGDSFTLIVQNSTNATGTVDVAVGGDANTTIKGSSLAITTTKGAHLTFVITNVATPAVFVLVSQ